jgi:hypothetical protein
MPDIACPSKDLGVACKGITVGGVDNEFDGVVGGECENEWHRVFGVQNQKLSHLGLVSV